ncbi:protein of unknown function [Paenibacillus alvei]|uniref:Uncharacterized protein n=1 Tax=Paenibacillus alvei TaxID=44250 RepID=A0A383RB68_PAEAL|nr:protein of unknown function [Paenibacillus alvei]
MAGTALFPCGNKSSEALIVHNLRICIYYAQLYYANIKRSLILQSIELKKFIERVTK